MDAKKIHMIIGSGPVGLAVMDELVAKGESVRVANRSGQARVPAGVEIVAVDANKASEVASVCADAKVLYHCAQPGYTEWTTKFMHLTAAIVTGAIQAGVPRVVITDNLYAYGPVDGPLTETLPRAGVTPKTKVRAEMEAYLMDVHSQGEIEIAIAKGSDFYGPRCLETSMGSRVFPNLLKGKAAQIIGDPDQPHSYTYIRDFAKVMVTLGERAEASGQIYHVPQVETLTTRQFLQRATGLADLPLKVSVMPKLMMNILSLFIPILKEVKETQYQMNSPWVNDGRKFTNAFGDLTTPLDEALLETIRWYQDDYSG